MGESACLLRSFSHPSDASRESREGDPIRALTESVSFGRFMSESLAWEKWSTFSHNRYLEEVEKFSKPGSVAQKKAYFEAHYKKKAAMKAAALLEEANETPMNNISESESTDQIHDNPHINLELAEANTNMEINREQEKDEPNIGPAYSADTSAKHPDTQLDLQDKSEAKNVESIVKKENFTSVENSIQLENAEENNKIVACPEEWLPYKNVDGEESLSSVSKTRQALKSSINSRASKLPPSPAKGAVSVQHRIEKDAPESKRPVRDSVDRKKSTPSSSDRNKLIPKTLHMSINFVSRAADASKSLPKTLGTETKKSVNGISQHPLISKSEDRRTKMPVSKPVSGGMTVHRKWQTLSMDFSKSPSATGNKPRSPIISSPFNFRSEERVAKRKEFFQKLEEKNAKEAEKMQQERQAKVKADHNLKKLRQSVGFKARVSEDLNGGSQLPSDKKVSLTRPRSPKLGRKPTPTIFQNMSCRPPRWPTVNTENSKNVREKSNPSTTRMFTSLPKKKAQENASPNIQR